MIKQKQPSQPQKKQPSTGPINRAQPSATTRPDRTRAAAQPIKKQHTEFATPRLTDEEKQFADFVITCLDEQDKTAQWQIRQIVQALGHVRVLQLMRETLEIEQNGGMLTMDGERRRTPGGTFFVLCKRYHKYQVQHIFSPRPPRRTTPPAATATKPPTTQPVTPQKPGGAQRTPALIKKRKKA